jgi:hypothetical protein
MEAVWQPCIVHATTLLSPLVLDPDGDLRLTARALPPATVRWHAVP